MPCYSCIIRDIKEKNILSLRLDRYISENINLLSRSQIKARNLKAIVNGKEVKVSRLVKNGDSLELNWEDNPPMDIVPQDIPLNIIFENEDCIVVNKEQGMVVHPGAGNRQGTLANALYYRILKKGAADVGCAANAGSLRPGIVHRLDKDTSGVIIAAFNEEAHAFLAEQFKARVTLKKYVAIVLGVPKETKGKIETLHSRDPNDRRRFKVSANGKTAVTFYKVIKSWGKYSLLSLRPRTGRTHQLRVHMRHIGCPILGDPVYNSADKQFPNAALMLHSKSLAIILPGEANKRIFSTDKPQRFIDVIEKLDRIYKHE
ncbi:MAG: RluA family pseudouridine synthase [Treponema sp.]|nr:RluA family pseudouridine synthase [Treponema sp.]